MAGLRRKEVESQAPLGRALLDHHRSGRPTRVAVRRHDGARYRLETEEFFALDGALAHVDAAMLDAARGRVLDVGAGAGRHALVLQARGLPVVALESCGDCVTVMRERGVRRIREADVMALEPASPDERFDTVLFGMQTIGLAGTRLGLEHLLEVLRGQLAPRGQILADSSALRDGAGRAATPQRGQGPLSGEIEVAFRYGRLRGRPFPWLYLDREELSMVALACGFECEVLAEEEAGEYLARLAIRE